MKYNNQYTIDISVYMYSSPFFLKMLCFCNFPNYRKKLQSIPTQRYFSLPLSRTTRCSSFSGCPAHGGRISDLFLTAPCASDVNKLRDLDVGVQKLENLFCFAFPIVSSAAAADIALLARSGSRFAIELT